MYDVPTHLKTVEMLKAAIAAKQEYVFVADLHSAARYAFAALENFHSYAIRDIEPKKPEPGKVYMLLTIADGMGIRKIRVYQRDNAFLDAQKACEARPRPGPDLFDRTDEILDHLKPRSELNPVTSGAEIVAALNPIEPVATKHMVDITPNITVDQAKRIEDALNRRHAAGEELVRQFRDLLATGIRGRLDRMDSESLTELDTMIDTLKEWDEHNRAFTDAVFEKRPARIPEHTA
jgi:hypothetical protein